METRSQTAKAFEILLVEDRDDDAELARYAFRKVPVPFKLHRVADGVEALSYLRNEAPYEESLRPNIIFLDLNMPGMDGRELLAELKRDEDLKSIPAIVLSVSSAPDDVAYAYRTQAAAFITKPFELVRFCQIIKTFTDIWLSGGKPVPVLSGGWTATMFPVTNSSI